MSLFCYGILNVTHFLLHKTVVFINCCSCHPGVFVCVVERGQAECLPFTHLLKTQEPPGSKQVHVFCLHFKYVSECDQEDVYLHLVRVTKRIYTFWRALVRENFPVITFPSSVVHWKYRRLCYLYTAVKIQHPLRNWAQHKRKSSGSCFAVPFPA